MSSKNNLLSLKNAEVRKVILVVFIALVLIAIVSVVLSLGKKENKKEEANSTAKLTEDVEKIVNYYNASETPETVRYDRAYFAVAISQSKKDLCFKINDEKMQEECLGTFSEQK